MLDYKDIEINEYKYVYRIKIEKQSLSHQPHGITIEKLEVFLDKKLGRYLGKVIEYPYSFGYQPYKKNSKNPPFPVSGNYFDLLQGLFGKGTQYFFAKLEDTQRFVVVETFKFDWETKK